MAGAAARVRALDGMGAMAAAALAGAALALSQPPLSWWPAIFLALPPLLWLTDGASGPRAAFARGWAAGAGYFAAGMFWIVEPFLVDPERHGWMAPFALVLMAGGLALFWGAGFGLARLMWRPGLAGALVLAAIWTLADYARSNVLTGFPWALVGYGWIETPVMQVAALVGPHGLGFLTLVAGLAPAAAVGVLGLARMAALSAALLAAGWGFGALRLAAPSPERAPPVIVRLVQPNIAQDVKWRPELQEEFYERHLAATRAPGEPRPDVTIWSETAVSFVLGYGEPPLAEIAAAAAPQGRVILGVRRLEGEAWFNSLALLDKDGTPLAVYDKRRLVPFGEYIPLAGAIASLGLPRLDTLTLGGFTPGPGPRLIEAPGLPPFLPLICYEAIFPQAMRTPGGRPEWVVQATNDAWFGALAGPYQHLAQARARAIEQGLPIARAANTGVSAMIDPKGRVVASLPLGVAGRLDAPLPAPLRETIYGKAGDFPVLLAMTCIFLLTFRNFKGGVSLRRRG